MTETRDIEKKLQKSYRETRDINEQKAVDAIKTNSKYLFSYAKKFSKVVSGIGPLMDSAKTLVTSPTQMAEMLSTQYSSVFSEPKEEMEDPEVYSRMETTVEPHLTVTSLVRKPPHYSHPGSVPSCIPQCK